VEAERWENEGKPLKELLQRSVMTRQRSEAPDPTKQKGGRGGEEAKKTGASEKKKGSRSKKRKGPKSLRIQKESRVERRRRL